MPASADGEPQGTVCDTLTVEDQYAAQFFGFLPQSLMNGMYNAMWEYLKDAMSSFNEGVLASFGDVVSEAELAEHSRVLNQIAIKRLDHKFDTAESYLLKNVFNIPDHLVLPEDRQNVENPCTEADLDQLDQEIKHVTDRIIAVKYANASLKDRLEEVASLQQQLDNTDTQIDKIHRVMSAQSQQMVSTASQIQKAKSLLEQCSFDTPK